MPSAHQQLPMEIWTSRIIVRDISVSFVEVHSNEDSLEYQSWKGSMKQWFSIGDHIEQPRKEVGHHQILSTKWKMMNVRDSDSIGPDIGACSARAAPPRFAPSN
jgi:hypothetical protein